MSAGAAKAANLPIHHRVANPETPGIVLDLDAGEHVVRTEIEDASKHADLSRLEVSALPFSRLVFSERRASQG